MKHLLLALTLLSCSSGLSMDEAIEVTAPDAQCSQGEGYPSDFSEKMKVGSVLYPYSWPVAKNMASGAELVLDLAKAPCAKATDIDWSPFDKLLFISVPAW